MADKHTPLVEIVQDIAGLKIYAKLEGHNPSGSVKYRFAESVIQLAEQRGELTQGMAIIDTSAGSTALALALAAKEKGYHTEFLVPPWLDEETIAELQRHGAKVDVRPENESPLKPIEVIGERCRTDPSLYWTRQYFREDSSEIYHGLAEEILQQISETGISMDTISIDTFVACIGTGGTFTGISCHLPREVVRIAVVGESIPGIRPQGMTISYLQHKDIFDPASADHLISVCREEAGQGQEILQKNKITAGLSGGAALYALLTYHQHTRNPDAKTRHALIILADGKQII